jgi:hypothetical protein
MATLNIKLKYFVYILVLLSSFNAFAEKTSSEVATEEEPYDNHAPDWRTDPFVKTEFYLREYSAEHLRKNPKQIVKKMVIEADLIPVEATQARSIFGQGDDTDFVLVDVYVKYKHLPDWYFQLGYCSKPLEHHQFKCRTDSDAGQFTINLNNNKLILKGDIRMEMCGILAEEPPEGLENTTYRLVSQKSVAPTDTFALQKVTTLPVEIGKKVKACSDFFYSLGN